MITFSVNRRLLLGKSKICDGVGLFAGQKLKNGDFIGEYKGEILTFTEALERRQVIYKNMNLNYLFDLD